MNISDKISLVALVIPIVIGLISYLVNNNREKKQATLDAFNVLQEQSLDKLNQFSEKEYQKIADERKNTKAIDEMGYSGKNRYDQIRVLLARCEHFSVGVFSGIYDKKMVVRLAGINIYYLWKKLTPILSAIRSVPGGEESYKEFEKLVSYIETELNKK